MAGHGLGLIRVQAVGVRSTGEDFGHRAALAVAAGDGGGGGGCSGAGFGRFGFSSFFPFRFCYVSLAQFDVGFWRGRVWREKGVTPLVRGSLARVD